MNVTVITHKPVLCWGEKGSGEIKKKKAGKKKWAAYNLLENGAFCGCNRSMELAELLWSWCVCPCALGRVLGLGVSPEPCPQVVTATSPCRASLKAGMLRRRKTKPKGDRTTCRHVSACNKGLGSPKGVRSLLKGRLVGWFGFW